MKRWWLIIALLLSLGINIGILAMLALHRPRPADDGWRGGGPQPVAEHREGPRGAPEGLERLADRLGLAGETRQRFIEIQLQHFQATHIDRRRLQDRRRAMRQEITARNPNRERLEELVEEVAVLQRGLERSLIGMILDTRELLDERQERMYLHFLGRLRGFAAGGGGGGGGRSWQDRRPAGPPRGRQPGEPPPGEPPQGEPSLRDRPPPVE